jgi:signal transduction histidine kinase/ActR/RegA family two-component response regulator
MIEPGAATTAAHVLAQTIVEHLIDLSGGTFSLTREAISAEPDPVIREIFTGLRVLHEDLEFHKLESENRLLDLERAKKAAEQASQAKSEFLANMSHELRTPLNGLVGAADILCTTPHTDDQREYLGVIKECASVLTNLISDVLDFSKIEAGMLTVERIAVDIHGLVDQVGRLFTAKVREKEVELIVEVSSSVPQFVVGDPGRIRQILLNLIGNAVKFTSKGRITVRVESEGSEAREGPPRLLRVSVKDTGRGIPAAKVPHLFEKFMQADASSTRLHGGTGLGLAIARQLARLMGGDIGVTSVEGEGSTFVVTLPLMAASVAKRQDAALPAAPVLPRSARVRVLLVEDNALNVKIAKRLLEQLECEVEIANDGTSAVERAEGTAMYDLIFMDCQMPNLDGFEAAQLIRRTMPHRANVPIVALTANAMREAEDRCRAAGMDDYLSKPVRREQLRAVIERWCPRAGAALVRCTR